MAEIAQLPEWLGAALLGAVLAALGYIAKSSLELVVAARQRRRERRASLVELHSLLRAAEVTFVIQRKHAAKLRRLVKEKHAELLHGAKGLEEKFGRAYSHFGPAERELHDLIRSMTVNALRPTNQAILEWLRGDTYFKGNVDDKGSPGQLAPLLSQLEAHLILWHAKYETWIPDHPEHALVYLADEKRHGLGFPDDVDAAVAHAAGLPYERPVAMPST